MVDTAFVGHLGTPQLGALAIGTAAFTASFWIFSFLAYGLTPRVARAFGAGDQSEIDSLGIQAFWLACLCGISVTIAGVLLARPVVELLGARGPVLTFAEPYLRIRVLSAAPVLLVQAAQGWMRGVQDTKTPMIIILAGAALNAVLNYVLIYPLGMGVRGAAWATVIGQTLAATALLIAVGRRMKEPRLHFDVGVTKSLLRVGLDLTVRTGALLAAMSIATAVAARMSAVVLASWQIAMQMFLLLAFTSDSIAIAAQAMVGKFLGAADRSRAKEVSDRMITLGLALGAVLCLVLAAGAGPIARVFTGDPTVLSVATGLLVWVALIQPLSSFAFTLDGILIGASDTRFLAAAMVASSLLYAAASMFALRSGSGAAGLALAATLWLLARSATTATRFYRGRWSLQA